MKPHLIIRTLNISRAYRTDMWRETNTRSSQIGGVTRLRHFCVHKTHPKSQMLNVNQLFYRINSFFFSLRFIFFFCCRSRLFRHHHHHFLGFFFSPKRFLLFRFISVLFCRFHFTNEKTKTQRIGPNLCNHKNDADNSYCCFDVIVVFHAMWYGGFVLSFFISI